jgi:RNA polymerase sigma factor (sigma-70 family)
MKDIYTRTNAAFTTVNGEYVPYQEVFDSIKRSVEIYGRTGGKDLSAQELEDLFQDCVLKALKYKESYDPNKAKPQTWAGKIAKRAQWDAFREHNRLLDTYVHPNPPHSDKDEETIGFFDQLDGGFATDGEVETSEAMERIQSAISSLSENYQFIISLQMNGLKPKKMAELIGCTSDAAATLLCRARKALKKALGAEFLADYGIAA